MNFHILRNITAFRGATFAIGRMGWLFVAGLLLSLVTIWLLFAAVVYESYTKEWRSASLFLSNVSALLENDIARDLQRYDSTLQTVAESLSDPDWIGLPRALRQRVLVNQSITIDGLDTVMALNADGVVVFGPGDGGFRIENPMSRDYFRAQAAGATAGGLFISRPFKVVEASDAAPVWEVAVSRRMEATGGQFAGVALGTIGIGNFTRLFESVKMPPDSIITVLRDDSTVLARFPALGLGRATKSLSVPPSETYSSTGEYTLTSPLDGVNRFFAFSRIGRFPLTLHVGFPTSRIMNDWMIHIGFIAFGFLLLSGLIFVMAAALARELYRRTLAERTLSDLATTDSLTGLANRRHFDDALDEEWRRAARRAGPVALLMVDCDFFKNYNDAYGHLAGDEALRVIAAALRDCVQRPGDVVARFGGEEFAVLLPDTDLDGALIVGEAICAAVARLAHLHAASPFGRLTASIGAAACLPAAPTDALSIVQAADFALYEAKENGRNRVATSERLDLTDFNWRHPLEVALAS